MGEANSLFVAGARVAVITGYLSETVREDFVERVYKNGRFLLRSEVDQGYTKQWAPNRDGERAYPTGSRYQYGRESLEIWNESTHERLAALAAKAKRRDRIAALNRRVERLDPDDITEAALDAIEAALSMPEVSP